MLFALVLLWNRALQRRVTTSTRELRASETFLRAVFDAVNDGVLVVDIETQQFMVGNAAMGGMLGCAPDALARMTLADIHPAEAFELAADPDDLAQGLASYDMVYAKEFHNALAAKFGFPQWSRDDVELVETAFDLMQKAEVDMTLFFRPDGSVLSDPADKHAHHIVVYTLERFHRGDNTSDPLLRYLRLDLATGTVTVIEPEVTP